MFCEKCRTQNPDNAKFCATCGNPLSAADFGYNHNAQAYSPVPQPTYTPAPKPKGNGAFMALKFTSVALSVLYIVFGFLPILMVKGMYSYYASSLKAFLGIGGSPNFIEFFGFAGKCVESSSTRVYGILIFVACGLLILAMLLYLFYGIIAAVKKTGAAGLGIFAGVIGAVASILWIVMIFVLNGSSLEILEGYSFSAFPWIMVAISIVTIVLVALSISKSPKKQNNDYQQRYY